MAASIESRLPKASRKLLQTLFWFLGIASLLIFIWRAISGNTLEHERAEKAAEKERAAIAQSASVNPANVAALYESQLDVKPKAPTAPQEAPQSPQTGRAPEGPPPPPPIALDGERAIAHARASEIAMLEDGSDQVALLQNPVNGLMDQFQAIQQGAAAKQNQTVAEYLKAVQTPRSGGAPSAPSGPSRSGGMEWLSAQQAMSAEDAPLQPLPIAASEYFLQEGTPVRIALVNDMNSDLPGEFTAVVTRNVYDSFGHGHLLIPYGTKFRGRYNSEISPGQNRILFAFNAMLFPSGARVRLKGMPGSDLSGASGAEAEVDRHFWQQFGAALAIGTVAMFAGRNGNNANVTINLGDTASNPAASVATQALSDVVKQVLQRNANIRDTLRLYKGEELVVVINRDMDLPPHLTGVRQAPIH